MKTTLLTPETDENAVKTAAELIRAGEVVGMPTETVYGLAANALNGEAVKKIFLAKGRPQDNPLIVHIADFDQIYDLCPAVPPQAKQLADAFWPGPLTMIVPKGDCIPDEVSCGLDTVGIRLPSHPMARALIRESGVPLAAPSANTSGRPSTTTAAHVMHDMDGKIDLIVDGGACRVGVESTIVDLTGDTPRLLRPGGVTPEELERYTDVALAGMESGLFACLCHPDLPLKSYPKFDAHARDMSEILCRRAKELDLPLEYNLAGPRLRGESKGWGYTSDEFWDIAAQYSCKAIIALDAHQPEVIGQVADIAAARKKLAALGIQVLDRLPGLD